MQVLDRAAPGLGCRRQAVLLGELGFGFEGCYHSAPFFPCHRGAGCDSLFEAATAWVYVFEIAHFSCHAGIVQGSGGNVSRYFKMLLNSSLVFSPFIEP
jgi:hypothetical protein